MKLRSVLLSLTTITFLGGSSFASSVRSSYVPGSSAIVHHSAPAPHDTVLYDNGPDDGMQAYNITGFQVADSFNLATPSTLNSVTFSNWFFPTDSGIQVDWAITTAPLGGTTLFSGTAGLSETFIGTNGLGADVYSSLFSLGGLDLASGTYYLQLSNELTAQGSTGFWGESGGPSLAFQSGGVGQIPSESFQISGSNGPPPIPEPSSLVLLGTGLLGAAGAMRRKFGV